jgi:hypothetical protein
MDHLQLLKSQSGNHSSPMGLTSQKQPEGKTRGQLICELMSLDDRCLLPVTQGLYWMAISDGETSPLGPKSIPDKQGWDLLNRTAQRSTQKRQVH